LGLHRSSRCLLLVVIAFSLLTALLSAGPVSAHTFTKIDGNDSPSKIDLKAVSVSHTSNSVVHKVQTYNAWTPASLQHDSFFVIQIDKNNDRRYERCAFIFYTSRLRGSLSNCGAQFIRYLPVAKLSGTTARITIPKSETGLVHWWSVASLWDGPAPCGNGCVDFSPNRFPDILHEMKPPVVSMPDPNFVRVWDGGTISDFAFPFSVTDAHSGIGSWTVQRSPAFGPAAWTPVSSGTESGSQSPTLVGTPPGRFKFRVVALDKQGNQAIGDPRYVHVPTDISTSGPGVFSDSGASETPLAEAWGGGYVPLDAGEAYTLEVTTPDDGCLVELVGPGSGDWVVDVDINGFPDTINASQFDDGPRQMLYSWCVNSSLPTTFTFTVTSGTGFGVDAVVI
jgi:hypothetical protein